eukprot:TRINITY_DN12762_c0_g1_i1.p1 TRINITY_DN12762_c0_g1~~TRINITY_DN12762_c0_g1_i1.p1  ORF type:complete len:1008 (+),score=315.34 TRINITY_DN12762_c0_g1_i1:154-3177(+)
MDSPRISSSESSVVKDGVRTTTNPLMATASTGTIHVPGKSAKRKKSQPILTQSDCIFRSAFSAPQPRSSLILYNARTVIDATCRSLQFDEIQIANIFSAFDNVMKNEQVEALSAENSFLDPVSDSARYHLERAVQSTQLLLKYQNDIPKIITVQSYVRGFITRARNKRACPEGKAAWKRYSRRNTQFRKLLKNEREYIASLSCIINDYLHPMRYGAVKGVEKYDLADIFCNVENIQEEHRKLQVSLLSLLKHPDWPFFHGIGRCIQMAVRTMLPAYGIYTENVDQQMDTLLHLKKTNPAFATFVKTVAIEGTGVGLASNLHLPLNHVSSRMKIMLESMWELCEPGDPEYNDLESAVEIMRKAADNIIESMEHAPQRANLKQSVRRIISDHPLGLDASASRQMICEGPLVKYGREKKGWFMLFTDLLVIGEAHCQGAVNMLRTPAVIPLRTVREVTNEPESLEDSKYADRSVSMQRDDGTVMVLKFQNETERDEWLQHVRGALENVRRLRVIGKPLEKVVKADGSLPIFDITSKYLEEEENARTKGIFRIPGRATSEEQLRIQFETETPESIDLSSYTVHDVGGVLRSFLRELPSPLVPFNLFDDAIELQRGHDEAVGRSGAAASEVEPSAEYLAALTAIVVEVPQVNRNLMLRLFALLRRIATFHEHNQMDVKNLAMVFAPSVLRPLEETLSTAMLSPFITAFVCTLIKHMHTMDLDDELSWAAIASTNASAIAKRSDSPGVSFSALDLSSVSSATSRPTASPRAQSARAESSSSLKMSPITPHSPSSSEGHSQPTSPRSASIRSAITGLVSPRSRSPRQRQPSQPTSQVSGIISGSARCRSLVHTDSVLANHMPLKERTEAAPKKGEKKRRSSSAKLMQALGQRKKQSPRSAASTSSAPPVPPSPSAPAPAAALANRMRVRVLLEDEAVAKTFLMQKNDTLGDVMDAIYEKRCREEHGVVSESGLMGMRKRYANGQFFMRNSPKKLPFRTKIKSLKSEDVILKNVP